MCVTWGVYVCVHMSEGKGVKDVAACLLLP